MFAGLALTAGCGPSADDPLPSEDDLLVYSLAVAEKVRLQLPEGRYVPVYHVGRVYQRFGLEEKALEHFRRAVELRPNAPEPLRETGFILSQRKDRMEEAVAAYRQSLAGDPTQSGIHTRVGLLYIYMRRFEDAVVDLEAELAGGGANDLTHYNLGLAYQELKRNEEAIEHFDLAAEGMQNALYGKYNSLKALGRMDEAKATMERFRARKKKGDAAGMERDLEAKKSNHDVQLRNTGETWLDAATAYVQEAHGAADHATRLTYMNKAVHACREALRFDNRQIESWDFLIDHYGQRGMHAECHDVLVRAIEVFPSHAVWRYRLAMEFLRRAPKDRPTQPSADADASIAQLEKAIELAPRFHEAHLLMSRAILHFKRRPELLTKALEHALVAFELSEERTAENYDILAMAQHFAGERRDAYETLRTGVRVFPDDPGLTTRLSQYQKMMDGATP